MRSTQALRVTGILISSLAFTGGCTDSEGLDLTVRGKLSLHIDRETTSAQAKVFGSVNDIKSFFFPVVVPENGQVLMVNNVTIPHLFGLYGGDIAAVNAPDGYTVSFEYKGNVKSLVVTPLTDFTSVTPADGSEVSRQGFEINWSPSGDADALVDVKIRGFRKEGYYGDDDDKDDDDPDRTAEFILNLPDNGKVTIGAADLSKFKNGEIDLSVSRYRKFSGDLGVAETSIRVSNTSKKSLTLTD